MSPKARVLHWFRTDLRIHDAPALQAGLTLKPEAWYPVWCWDPEYVYSHRVGVNRFSFLIESMNDLSRSLSKLNDKSKLLVIRGSPYSVLPKLFHDWKITHLVYEIDTGGYAQLRDKIVREIAARSNVEVVAALGHSLYHPADIIEKNGGKATTTVAQWQKAASKLGSVPRPSPTPKKLPPPGDLHLSSLSRENHPINRDHDLNEKTRIGPVTCFDTLTGPDGDFAIPTLEELGYPLPTTTIHGGETVGRTRLFAFNAENEGNRAALFEKPKTSPAVPGPFGTSQSIEQPEEQLGLEMQEHESEDEDFPADVQIDVTKPSTTLMSPYLKFGCVGVRECYWSWHDILVNAPKSAKKPENLIGQLEFRDMYYAAELAVGGTNFARVQGNSICRYIPWHCSTVYSEDGNPINPRPKDEKHPQAEEWLAAWSEGRTGFPWIDALMRQLREEGWMHHLGRHSVACFLTRGQCYISWERGAEVFDEYLIDWDPASNYGNWMWLSCSAFFSQFLRIYGTATWPSKFDTTGALVRKYIPELRKFPDKYIYEPWLAPTSVQQGAGCIIGKDYPAPMLDEKEEKGRNIERMRAAYRAGLYGNAPEVLAGTVVIDTPVISQDAEVSRAGMKRKAEKSGGGKAGSTRTLKTSSEGQKSLDAYMKKK
ncbi:FAD binding domain of DNA photolyase-domain-containing protein [Rhizoctonia solani]|nr:FAD binding domain of DNA photolyase-domain-containing protein [Rhizoctonia solani]